MRAAQLNALRLIDQLSPDEVQQVRGMLAVKGVAATLALLEVTADELDLACFASLDPEAGAPVELVGEIRRRLHKDRAP